VPSGLELLREEFGADLEVDARYVDENNRWGEFYGPRQLIASSDNLQINKFPLHPHNNQYLSEIEMGAGELGTILENAKLGKGVVNLVEALGLVPVFSYLESKAVFGAPQDLGEIAAAWDYYLLTHGQAEYGGYSFDRFNPNAGRVDHHVSAFAGFPVIYIPLNKLFSSRKAFGAGVKYLTDKFSLAKKAGVLADADVQAIVIEVSPAGVYHLNNQR